MKYKYILIIFAVLFVALAGCRKPTTVEVRQDGANVVVSIPADATAAELIQMRGVLDASLTIKAERERMAFALKQAQIRKSERQFYAVLVVSGVVTGIVSIFAVACGVLVWKFGGLHK